MKKWVCIISGLLLRVVGLFCPGPLLWQHPWGSWLNGDLSPSYSGHPMGYGLTGAMSSSIFSSQLKSENIKDKTLCTLLFGSVHIHHTFHLYGTWSVSSFHCVTNFTHKVKPDLRTKHQTLKMLRLVWNTTSYNQYHKLLLGKMRKELLIKYQDIQRCLLRRE